MLWHQNQRQKEEKLIRVRWKKQKDEEGAGVLYWKERWWCCGEKEAAVEKLFHLEMKGGDGERVISKGNITLSYLFLKWCGEGRKGGGAQSTSNNYSQGIHEDSSFALCLPARGRRSIEWAVELARNTWVLIWCTWDLCARVILKSLPHIHFSLSASCQKILDLIRFWLCSMIICAIVNLD